MDTAFADPLTQVPGLDPETGMRRMMNKRPLYLAILRRYVDGQRDCLPRIRDAVRSGDWKTAERIAHTARGVAGTIGAELVAERAGAVEDALRVHTPESAIEGLLETFGGALQPLISGLETALPVS